jgi:predicted nucleotidyltransferase
MTVAEQVRQVGVQVAPEVLENVVERVVAVAEPEHIVLFGSAARGEMRSDSDLDLLVVKDGDYNHRRLTAELYRALASLDWDTDIVVATAAQIKRYKDSFCLVLYRAVREGKVIYDKAAL